MEFLEGNSFRKRKPLRKLKEKGQGYDARLDIRLDWEIRFWDSKKRSFYVLHREIRLDWYKVENFLSLYEVRFV